MVLDVTLWVAQGDAQEEEDEDDFQYEESMQDGHDQSGAAGGRAMVGQPHRRAACQECQRAVRI